MSTVSWSEALSVGIDEIDGQHRGLIELVATLDDALARDADRHIMAQVIRQLNSYAHDHFTTEERWMARHAYPDLQEHIRQHEEFVDRLLHFELDHLTGKAKVSREILDYLSQWLREHVSGFDQRYAAFFRAQGLL